LQAVYDLPAGFMVSAQLRQPRRGPHGAPPQRALRHGHPGEREHPPAEARDLGRLPDVSLLDMRLQKDFKLKDNVRFSVFVDALNLLNEDA
jgi:hypothetical protein